MAERSKVACDYCENDLTTTDNCEDYRLGLFNQSIPSAGDIVTALGIQPLLSKPCHFCGFECLKLWLNGSIDRPRHEQGES